jgi:hypothetical protein
MLHEIECFEPAMAQAAKVAHGTRSRFPEASRRGRPASRRRDLSARAPPPGLPWCSRRRSRAPKKSIDYVSPATVGRLEASPGASGLSCSRRLHPV